MILSGFEPEVSRVSFERINHYPIEPIEPIEPIQWRPISHTQCAPTAQFPKL